MISTENVSPATSLTVSDTPSSATEPLGGDEAGKRPPARAASVPRHVGQIVARDQLGDAVDMAADQVPAELVADPKRRVRD